jgi:hypothetical protein
MLSRWSILLLTCLVTSACTNADPLASQHAQSTKADSELLAGGILATLTLEPSAVQRTHSFTVTMTLRNTTAAPAVWTSGMGCLAFLNVYDRSGQRVPLHGTNYACLAVVTNRTLAPGESLSHTWEVVAQTVEGQPLLVGEYVLEADPVLADGRTLRHSLRIL